MSGLTNRKLSAGHARNDLLRPEILLSRISQPSRSQCAPAERGRGRQVGRLPGLGIGELGHDLLDEGFFDAVMNHGVRRLGPATIAGKQYLVANSGGANLDLIDTFILLGDPASSLPIQFQNLSYYLPFIKKQ